LCVRLTLRKSDNWTLIAGFITNSYLTVPGCLPGCKTKSPTPALRYSERVSESFLILHGLGNHRPPQHWEFLLAAQLVDLGHDVRYPDLPDSDAPDLSVWLRVLHEEFAELKGSHRTVICHSLSCLLWFHASANMEPADRVLLVVPPQSDRLPDYASTFRLASLNVAAVRSSAKELAIVGTDNDPFNPAGPAIYGDPLGVTPIVIAGAGHLTPSDGYGPWPFVLNWCIQTR